METSVINFVLDKIDEIFLKKKGSTQAFACEFF